MVCVWNERWGALEIKKYIPFFFQLHFKGDDHGADHFRVFILNHCGVFGAPCPMLCCSRAEFPTHLLYSTIYFILFFHLIPNKTTAAGDIKRINAREHLSLEWPPAQGTEHLKQQNQKSLCEWGIGRHHNCVQSLGSSERRRDRELRWNLFGQLCLLAVPRSRPKSKGQVVAPKLWNSVCFCCLHVSYGRNIRISCG